MNGYGTILKKFSDFTIKSDRESLVSRNHCEIYTVVYEPGINHIYVRDRKSFNGTYVNNMLVGKGPDLCSGYLLEDGDTIEILPYWKFILHQDNSPPKIELSKIQLAESRVRVTTKTSALINTNIHSFFRTSTRFRGAVSDKE